MVSTGQYFLASCLKFKITRGTYFYILFCNIIQLCLSHYIIMILNDIERETEVSVSPHAQKNFNCTDGMTEVTDGL